MKRPLGKLLGRLVKWLGHAAVEELKKELEKR